MTLVSKFADSLTRTILSAKEQPVPGLNTRVLMALDGWTFGAEPLGNVRLNSPLEIRDYNRDLVAPTDSEYLGAVRQGWADNAKGYFAFSLPKLS